MQMAVVPTHSRLQNPVQLGKDGVAGQLDLAPDGRIDVEQMYTKTINSHVAGPQTA
jgi:hypothetical protein